ncbi:unnamed protein product [Agarophyton chilense]|eukprot:gb/GEZJ01001851.1/.p1 GENE.gb/GEZJ01001851.1/~~gb/GEZJ01001851.1/.p1  ORF type:complete len:612 (+),score=57.72 gb/GEZJ01001851.1/:5876-7711(+)
MSSNASTIASDEELPQLFSVDNDLGTSPSTSTSGSMETSTADAENGNHVISEESNVPATPPPYSFAGSTPSSFRDTGFNSYSRLPFFQLSPTIRNAIAPAIPPQDGEKVTVMNLPNEVVDLVFRYLSSRPRAKEPLWENYAHARNAMSFALTNSRFLSLFRARIVAIRTKPERFREDLLYTTPHNGVVIEARNPQDVNHFSNILRLAGPALRELVITKNLPNHSWVDGYIKCVTQLRKLSLRDVNAQYPLELILEASSRTLRELELVGATGMGLSTSQLNAMATYCSSVTSLALRLSMFDHDWTNVWMGVGPGLKRLSLGATRFWIMDTEEVPLLEMVGRYCPDIEDLHFYHLGPTLGMACARLCARYGSQLKELEFEQSQLLRPDLMVIRDECREAQLSVSHGSSLFSHSYNVDVIDVLGEQIRTLRYRSQLSHDESLWEIGRGCGQLRELRLDSASTLTEQALESVLGATAARLESLSLSFFVRGVERTAASCALRVLAARARRLRELYIGGQQMDVEAFSQTMAACATTLERVSVTFGFRTAAERSVIESDSLVQVVRATHVCARLRSLVVIDRTSRDSRGATATMREAVFPLRARAERVSVCGVHFV